MWIVIAAYVACVALCWGLMFADVQAVVSKVAARFWYKHDAIASFCLSLLLGLLGPFGVLGAFFTSRFGCNGFRIPYVERWLK